MKAIFNKTVFKRLILIFGVVLLIILAAIGYFFAPKEKKKHEEAVEIKTVFQEIPTPLFPAQPGLSFAPEFSFSTTLTEDTASLPETVKVYKIATFSATPSGLQAAKEIAARFGLSENPSDLGDTWQFKSGSDLLFVNKANLSWDLEWGAKSESIITLSKEELIQKVSAFLKERLLWKKVLNEAAVEAVGYDDTGVVLGKPADSANPDLWILSWTIQKDNLPIYSSSEEPVLTATVTKFGEVKKVHYGAFDIEFEVAGTYPAIGIEDLLKALAGGKGIIVEAEEPGRFYSSVTGQISEFSAQQIDNFYYQDSAQGYLVPVVGVSGRARTDGGKYVVLKVWMPEISPEWLK